MHLRLVLAACLATLLAGRALAQAQPAPPPVASQALSANIAELPGVLAGTVPYESYFAPAFRAAIPAERFAAITAQLRAAAGAFQRIERITPSSPYAAEVQLGFANGIVATQLAVDPAEPHLVTGLRITGLTAREASLGAIATTLASLPGRTGFLVVRLGNGAPAPVVAKDADTPLAVGSGFKLVILAELVRSTAVGERHWDDTITLDGAPLPGGNFTRSPAGTKVTLRALATAMISISDNSAADLLLRTLGRATVEAMLPVLGVADPARDRPLLATLDMFKLKGIAGLADRYLAADETGRRALLDGAVAAAPLTAIDESRFKAGQPYLIDRIEWFFSPADLVRMVDWLRVHTETGPAAEARAILALNPGVTPETRARWRYIGFKGGSEPGVMNLTQLLHAPDGSWWAISFGWNDPAHDVDQLRLAGLMTRADELAAR